MTAVLLRYQGRDRIALDGLSLHVAAGQSLALVGPSGPGKSSLADVILSVVTPQQ